MLSIQILKFKKALAGFYVRWTHESDLDALTMAEASADVINAMCDEAVIDFEPDDGFIDQVNEEEEEE